jgi:hypothetical protein
MREARGGVDEATLISGKVEVNAVIQRAKGQALYTLGRSDYPEIVYTQRRLDNGQHLSFWGQRCPDGVNLLGPSLDTPTLQTLNAKIAIDGQDAKQVAATYLKDKGFIK